MLLYIAPFYSAWGEKIFVRGGVGSLLYIAPFYSAWGEKIFV